MSVENEALTTLSKEIIKVIKLIIDNAKFDKTKKGVIVSHINGKYYQVQLDGQIYKAYSPSFSYEANDIVYVKIAENNYNNLIIEYPIR